MKISIDEWILHVKTQMEEANFGEDIVVTIEGGLNLDHYIRAKLPDAIRECMLLAPQWLCPVTDLKENSVLQLNQDGSGTIELPADCLRMVSFKMNGWRRAVTNFIDEKHPLWSLQDNLYTRGGVEKPVCRLGINEGGKPTLSYFSLPSYIRNPEIEQMLCILMPHPENNSYDLPEQLFSPITCRCAALVYELMGQADMANQLMQRSLIG